jgi:hypothetical protein
MVSEYSSERGEVATYMSSLYTLRRSLPFKPALTNACPNAGVKYNVARNATSENPRDEYRAGSNGTGSIYGLRMSHVAVGRSTAKTALLGSGRGFRGGAIVCRLG